MSTRTFRWQCWNFLTSISGTFQSQNRIDKETILDVVEDSAAPTPHLVIRPPGAIERRVHSQHRN